MKLIIFPLILISNIVFAQSWTLYGKIVSVYDGDGTVRLLDSDNTQHKIRLASIDAPELKQAFGRKAKKYLSDMIALKEVKAFCHKIDQYERSICKLISPKSLIDYNLEMVKAGLAWHYKKYQSEQAEHDRQAYSLAELEAKKKEQGLWADKDPVAPWEWRSRNK